MKKHRRSSGLLSDPIANMAATVAQRMADRSLINTELLRDLVLAVAAYEKVQRRFREAVVVRLSRIEMLVKMVHGAQLGEVHMRAGSSDEKIRAATKHVDDFLSQTSKELGLATMNYIYADSQPGSQARRTRRKRRE